MLYRRVSDAIDANVGMGTAILEPDSNSYFLLNHSGSVIWSELADKKTIGELAESLAERFEVSVEDCRSDVESILSTLRSKGLLDTFDENGS